MRLRTVLSRLFFLLAIILPGFALTAAAQTADLSGIVMDSSWAVVPKAIITAAHESTGVKRTTISDNQGLYRFFFLAPGPYTITVEALGFRLESRSAVKLDAGQEDRLDVILVPAALKQSTVVKADAPSLQTDSGTVGTEVDREFVENVPLNGRTFQSLIALVPGVVGTGPTATGGFGQFSVNGQRDTANYFTVDGVSGNVGITDSNGAGSVAQGSAGGGAIPAFNSFGATNNLVSVDAMQAFTLQTSTYSAELGRMPGGQLQIVTRSGSNAFHGDAFDYLRNDAFDANDWFANANGLSKSPLRQNDLGGDFGGPIVKNRTLFFFAFEGLRLRLPEFQEPLVPSLGARQSATGAIQQLLNAFPFPNGPEDPTTLLARFVANFSNLNSSDAASLRIDQVVNKSLVVFGRYSYAASNRQLRNFGSDLVTGIVNLRSFTAGVTLAIKPWITNEVRLNYTRNEAGASWGLDQSGGAVPPPDSLLFPSPIASPRSSRFAFNAGFARLADGRIGDNLQRQGNLVENTAVGLGSHEVRFGVDYRLLSPRYGPAGYVQTIFFDAGVPQMLTGIASRARITANDAVTLVFHNVSVYGQDSWKVTPRLTMTYGLRWELAPPPVAKGGQQLFTLTGFDSFSNLQLAPQGTALYHTTFDNFAPRLAAAYQLSPNPGKETVLRGGFGIYYDLGTGEVGDAAVSFPHTRFASSLRVPYPLSAQAAAPPPLLNLDPPYNGLFHAFSPGHELPSTYQWSFTVEQHLGSQQTLSASYVAAVGRGLLTRTLLIDPNQRFVGSDVYVTTYSSSSHYQALQIQFQRRLAGGLAALLSYTWSHSIDDASSDTGFDLLNPRLNRASSDFDVRNNCHAAFTYSIPPAPVTPFLRHLLRNWAIDAIVTAQTSLPADVFYAGPADPTPELNVFRPDSAPGVPVYVSDPTAPGGRRFNPAAFVIPPVPRRGTLGRNALRGFPLVQTDSAIRRRFDLGEKLNLQARIEFFNFFNHPNFSAPSGFLGISGPPFMPDPFFGLSTSMMAGQGALTALYDVGGPRSIQLALRLSF